MRGSMRERLWAPNRPHPTRTTPRCRAQASTKTTRPRSQDSFDTTRGPPPMSGSLVSGGSQQTVCLHRMSALPPKADINGAGCPLWTNSGHDHYSITSSANNRNDSGTVKPSRFAVFRFTTRLNFVGNCTGRSAGFAPRRMRST